MVQNFLLKAITTETIITNGTTTVNDLTGTYAIERLDRLFWVTRPTDTQLAPLAPGETVQVTQTLHFRLNTLDAFPPVGITERGPFLITPQEVFEDTCSITAT